MNEYMLFIKAKGNPVAHLPIEQQKVHIDKVGNFIGGLATQGKMKSAQPLEAAGATLSFSDGNFEDEKYDESQEGILGYYHLLADDLSDAISIAKADPRFEAGEWKIEVRPVLKVDGIN
ncbi:MAG: YciI family protein [Cyclobacteriaceae bacterium]